MFCEREILQHLITIQQINKKKNIKEQYGIEALKQLCLWERSVLRTCNYKNHRIFNLKCISHSLMPVSIKLRPTKSKLRINVPVLEK